MILAKSQLLLLFFFTSFPSSSRAFNALRPSSIVKQISSSTTLEKKKHAQKQKTVTQPPERSSFLIQLLFFSNSHNFGKLNTAKYQIRKMYLLTGWEGGKGKYMAQGPCVLSESRIFSHPARPNSVDEHFTI